MMRTFSPVLLFLFFVYAPLHGNVFRYDIIKGDIKRYVEWRLGETDEQGIAFSAENTMENVFHQMTLGQDFATLSWTFNDPDDAVHYQVTRLGDELVFRGAIGKEHLNRRTPIKDLPWLQIHGVSLPAFLRHGAESIEFFSIRPRDGKVFTFIAERQQAESIVVNGKTCRAIRVKVRLSGLLSYLGNVDYWFRQDDLMFVKYKGISGFPGSDPVIYELVERKETKQHE